MYIFLVLFLHFVASQMEISSTQQNRLTHTHTHTIFLLLFNLFQLIISINLTLHPSNVQFNVTHITHATKMKTQIVHALFFLSNTLLSFYPYIYIHTHHSYSYIADTVGAQLAHPTESAPLNIKCPTRA